MTVDHADLRAAAMVAGEFKARGDWLPERFDPADYLNDKDADFIALTSPDRILALCDELERKTAALEDAVQWAPRLRERPLVRAALEGKPAPSSEKGED